MRQEYIPSKVWQHLQLILLDQHQRPRPYSLQLVAQDPTVSRAAEQYDQRSVTGGLHDELMYALNKSTVRSEPSSVDHHQISSRRRQSFKRLLFLKWIFILQIMVENINLKNLTGRGKEI
jgi:hypothetical protein